MLVIHCCGFGKAGPAGIIDDIHNSLGGHLARAGFLVLIPDRRGFGELQPVEHYVWPSCGAGTPDARPILQADARAAFGTDLRGLQVFDLLIAVEYLASRDDVTSVGAAGLSGGGVLALYVAGQTETIDAVVLANSLSYKPKVEASNVSEGSETSLKQFNELPRTPLERLQAMGQLGTPSPLSVLVDNPYLVPLALLPPRPILIQFGNQDPVNYLKGGEEAIELVRALYGQYGAMDRVFVSIEPGMHEFFPEPIISFFSGTLNEQ